MDKGKKHYYTSDEEILCVLKKAEHHQFKEFDINHRLSNPNNKGLLGHIVEEGILGYQINSDPNPDIPELNLEVKTTGYIKNKKGIKAKERLAIDSLNYCEVVTTSFEESLVWKKCRRLLLVFYEFKENTPAGDFYIIKSVINSFTDEDRFILKRDFDFILNKIKLGKAETISEGDTMYLGAATSGEGKLVKQPYSSIKAKQRKFCLKQSFFTSLVQKHIKEKELETILSADEIRENTFEIAIKSKLASYFGYSESRLKETFGLSFKKDKNGKLPKQRYETYVKKILGIKGNVDNAEEFLKSNLKLKTIRVQSNDLIKESMSFPAFKFKDIVRQDWESSDIHRLFENSKFMFVIFREVNKEMILSDVRFWNMANEDLDCVGVVFDQLKDVLSEGNIVYKIKCDKNGKKIRYNNFPKKKNRVCHIRPHGTKNETYPLPFPDKLTGLTKYTKQCFWLNNDYIASIIGLNKRSKRINRE